MSVLSPIDEKRYEYTKLLEREKRAEKYFDDLSKKQNNAFITDEELKQIEKDIEMWTPKYNEILARLEELLQEIGYYKPENISYGWPEIKNENETEEERNSVREDIGYKN